MSNPILTQDLTPNPPDAGARMFLDENNQPTTLDAAGNRLALGVIAGTAVETMARVDATGTVTFSDVPDADDTITVGTTVITVVAADPVVGESMLAGASATAAGDNLVAALANEENVTAANDAGEVTITATLADGTDGNAIALAKDGTNIAVSGAVLSGGTDATVRSAGAVGSLMMDDTNLYGRTPSGVWKKVAWSSL